MHKIRLSRFAKFAIILVGGAFLAGFSLLALYISFITSWLLGLSTEPDTLLPRLAVCLAIWFGLALSPQFAPLLFLGRADIEDANNHPDVTHCLQDVAAKVAMPRPQLVIVNSAGMNAFTVGLTPGSTTVVISTGLIETLTLEELEAVFAHELEKFKNLPRWAIAANGLIRNGAALLIVLAVALATIAVVLVASLLFSGLITLLYEESEEDIPPLVTFIALLAALPVSLSVGITAMIASSVIPRRSILAADAAAARLTGNPQALIRALKKVAINSNIEAPFLLWGSCFYRKKTWYEFLAPPRSNEARIANLRTMRQYRTAALQPSMSGRTAPRAHFGRRARA